jgi:hypothetical protein
LILSFQGWRFESAYLGKRRGHLFYRTNGKCNRVSLGNAALMSLADARTAARQVLGGRASAVRSTGQTFEAFCDVCFERASIRPRTEHEYRGIIVRDLTAWRGLLVASLTRDDAFKVLDPIIKRGSKVEANRTHQLMVSRLNVAVDPGWTQSNVARGIGKPGGQEHRRGRALNVDEVARLWLALDAEKPEIAAGHAFHASDSAAKIRGLGLE